MDRALASLPNPQRAVFTDLITNAKARGLPQEPLIDKVLEGSVKRAQPDLVIAVVRNRMELLARAQTLSSSQHGPEIVQVADAIQRGVPDATIRQLRVDTRKNQRIGMAAHTLADLLDADVSSTVALQMLGSWRSRGAVAAQLRELPAAVERLTREGANPTRAGTAIVSAMRGGGSPNAVRMTPDLREGGRAADLGGRAAPRNGTSIDRPTVVPRPDPPAAPGKQTRPKAK